LFLLAVLRLSAWLAVLIGSVVTYIIAVAVWHMPLDSGALAYLYGSATGVWNVDWITIWGVMLFNTLVVTGVFQKFRRWLVAQGTADVRVQTMLFAWAFGALLEGLVGFGYPWAFVAPILITLGIPGSRRGAGRRARQQCTGFLWCPRRADYRLGRRNRIAADGVVGLGRPY
jgi:lactate permease